MNEKIDCHKHIWKLNDSFHKISYKYFGSTKFWKQIAEFNGYTLEWQPKQSNVIYIPKRFKQD